MSNEVNIKDLIKLNDFDENDVERISFRKFKPSLDIVDPDPTWPSTYAIFASRIITALGPPSSSNGAGPGTGHLASVSHVGSTSVPGLPAKAIIDIDVVVPDINDESAYVSALESQGFQFMLREPKWYGHRFFTADKPMFANVHVWGPACPAAERHRIFKEWLIENVDDRDLYARTKKECSEASKLGGESIQEYNDRKEGVIEGILHRAFKRLGYVE
ncbi:non sense mediated decay [Hyphodiscus hymeniophilus]|uniref:Non sense mediated decay n=1 Tax=Hyphodiscus hymeniophilus TaxID=353542 RepID=A0A9P6VEV7_9HELO|nr:non sense mediated decay [Hyphodiscus hymeniophilus]